MILIISMNKAKKNRKKRPTTRIGITSEKKVSYSKREKNLSIPHAYDLKGEQLSTMVAMSTKIRSIKILHGRPLDGFVLDAFPLAFVATEYLFYNKFSIQTSSSSFSSLMV